MTSNDSEIPSREEVSAWMRKQLRLAVTGSEERGIFDESLVEVKPAWNLPMRLVVGIVRAHRDPRSAHWFICGEVPLDYLPPDTVASPREALRHFALKWQLDAERTGDPEKAQALIGDAEAIYAVAEEPAFWNPQT